MENVGKVLMAGDWHGSTAWMEKVLRRAATTGFTALVQVGDLAVLWPAANGDDKFTEVLKRRLDEHGITMIFVDGNHDVHPKLRALPRNGEGFGAISDRLLYAPRGHRWELDGVRFGALGGAYSIDRFRRKLGKSWWEGEEVMPGDVERLGTGPLDVLITHEVPAGIDVAAGFPRRLLQAIQRDSYASRLLVAEAVRNTTPHLVFSGHWHQRRTGLMPGTRTRVHVLHQEFCGGNLVSLDLQTLAVEEFTV
ncbi:metallophosphoesterase family protein [Arthrobacter mobilis]|uniref:Metallophosphoesterase n=1 Tax=Arthrobacter mobilis TaxID=2724944 RepID=A0A7X6HE90_9MICC|nr:metallophosphoesterase [Arthrobacter mobilis]NKX55542.1 metallophosphoesterase [Arthrobacter mobilis]